MDYPMVKHLTFTHLPRFQPLAGTSTAYAGSFFSCAYMHFVPRLYLDLISCWSGLYYVLLPPWLLPKQEPGIEG